MNAVKTQKKKKVRWVRFRHKIVRGILFLPFYIFVALRYRLKIERLKMGKERQYCVLYNHQTAYDQFIVHVAFYRHLYHIASEDLFSKGWISKALTWLVAPIPFRKSTSDLTGVKNCIRVAREGGSIAMAPEGNRTYSGTTENMKASVASLVKALGIPLALFRIEGGYGVHPRWSDTIRRGKMRAYVARIVEPEEYKNMSNEELFAIIQQVLMVDEREDKTLFYGERLAEYLDRAMYVCPDCGLSVFHSERDMLSCTKCGKQIRYLPSKELEGVNCEFPYRYVKDWYDAQNEFVRNLNLTPYENSPLYEDVVCCQESIYCQNKRMIDAAAKLSIYANRIEIGTQKEKMVLSFCNMTGATVLGRNKLNLYIDGKTYQIAGDKHFNAVKYLNLYHHGISNKAEGTEFLGL